MNCKFHKPITSWSFCIGVFALVIVPDTGLAPNALCAYEGKARAAGNAHKINQAVALGVNNIRRFIDKNPALIA
jgi:hypothetical protein